MTDLNEFETSFVKQQHHVRAAKREVGNVKALVEDSRRATTGLQHAMDKVYRLVGGTLGEDVVKSGRKLAKEAKAEGVGKKIGGLKDDAKAKLKVAQDKVDSALKERKKVEADVGIGHSKLRKIDPRVEVAVEAHFSKENNPPVPVVDKNALDKALAFKKGQDEAEEVAKMPILGKKLGPQ